jgi:predicted phosphodiesterase
MLDIQIVSDVHAEFWAKKQKFNFIKPSAPILALLGDICCCGSDDDFEIFKRFILELLPSYEHIIVVPGNHEYYFNPDKKTTQPTIANTIDGIDAKIKAYFKLTSPKLHYLNNSTLKLTSGKQSYYIIGTTLWSWIPENQRSVIQNSMNDYQFIYTYDGKKINKLTSNYITDKHLKNYKYIRTQVNKAKKTSGKVIVLTHHKPYLSDTYNPTSLDVAYESDLSDLFLYPIVLWAYGHTHIADNSMHGKTWFYSNPKGYPKQKTNYKKAAAVKI